MAKYINECIKMLIEADPKADLVQVIVVTYNSVIIS